MYNGRGVFVASLNQKYGLSLMSFLAAVLVVSFAGAAFAQSPTGTFTGTITDAQGAAMIGVSVVARNTDTGVDQQPVQTNSSGIYTIPLLPPGTYDITASQTGFATVKRPALPLQVGQTVRIDVEMPVASQQSLVTVTTEVPLLETEKTESSTNVSENLVANLPVSTRNWQQFVTLTAGVNPDGDKPSFNGINGNYNNNSVDGANNNSNYNGNARGGGGGGYTYSGDSVREFQVSSGGFSAEQGQSAGGTVNAVTKSGTNQIRGDLFYYGRTASFNALDHKAKWDAAKNGTTATQSVHQQHQYGASVGGPLIKDKLFFFTTLDGYRQRSVSNTASAQINPPIQGLTCPVLAIGVTPNFYTAAQQATMNTQCQAAKTWVNTRLFGNFPSGIRQDIELVKFDYQLNGSNHLNVVANIRDVNSGPLAGSLSYGGRTYNQSRFVIANWSAVLGSNKVNEVRYQYGVDNQFSGLGREIGSPSVALSSIFTYGLANGNTHTNERRHQISDNFSWTKGAHQFKFGADINFIKDNARSASNSGGLYSYSSAAALPTGVTCPTITSAQSANNIFCDWLVDAYRLPDTGASAAVTTDDKTGQHWTSFTEIIDYVEPGPPQTFQYIFNDSDYAAYAQDNWKLRPSMTLNWGIRWDAQVLPTPPNSSTRVYGANDLPLLKTYTSQIKNEYNIFQPRVGFAWNFRKTTVLRLGGGLYYAKTVGSAIKTIVSGAGESNANCTSPTVCADKLIFPNVFFNQQDIGLFAPPLPGAVAGIEQKPASLVTPMPSPTIGIRAISPDAVRPRAWQFQAGIEQTLPGRINLSVMYSFTRGNHLPTQHDANLNGTIYNKTYDVVDAAGVTQLQTTVPLYWDRIEPKTGPVIAQFSDANTLYHGLLINIRKPMSHGVEILANYTLSRATDDGQAGSGIGAENFLSTDGVIDPYNRHLEQGYSGSDVRNRSNISAVYSPTYFKDVSNKLERLALNGWTMSGTLTLSNGSRANATVQGTTGQCLQAVSASSCPKTGGPLGNKAIVGINGGMSGADIQTTGNVIGGRVSWLPRASLKDPDYYNVDFRLAKLFTINERMNIEVRGEAFNLFNHSQLSLRTVLANYAQPGGSGCPNSGANAHTNTCMIPVTTFGDISSTGGGRQMQAGLRFNF